MNAVYSPGTCCATDFLEQREKELEKLMSYVDQLQEEVDEKNENISKIVYDISKSKQELNKLKKIKNAVDIEPVRKKINRKKEANLDEIFSGEHLEYLKEKKNIIADLSFQIEQLKSETSSYDEEVHELQRNKMRMMRQQAETRRRLQEINEEQKRIKEETFITKLKLKEINTDLKNHERLRKDVETSVRALLCRKDVMLQEGGENGEIPQSIQSLDAQIGMITMSNIQLQQDLDNDAQLYEDDFDHMNGKIMDLQNKVNWGSEQNNLRTQIQCVHNNLMETKKEKDDLIHQINIIEARLQKLTPLANKWAAQFRGTQPPEDDGVSIDYVLQQFQKSVNTSMKKKEKDAFSLDNLVIENAQLEAKIIKMKEELERQMVLFFNEQGKLKNNIQSHRTGTFEQEQKIVSNVNKLRIKMARNPKSKTSEELPFI